MNFLYVFIGGGLGSICRYSISLLLKSYNFTFPYATLLANIVSCILLGYLVAIGQKGILSSQQSLLFATGFCGGFSTFSTFSSEVFLLMSNGQIAHGLINIAVSILICLGAIYAGFRLGG